VIPVSKYTLRCSTTYCTTMLRRRTARQVLRSGERDDVLLCLAGGLPAQAQGLDPDPRGRAGHRLHAPEGLGARCHQGRAGDRDPAPVARSGRSAGRALLHARACVRACTAYACICVCSTS
jgi:hypothetical protein